MFDTQCVLIRIPCIRPTVHLICRHSRATVGLYVGETVCFILSRNPSVHRPNTNHSDSLHTSDGAFDMRALTGHRRAVCRGNRVFWGNYYKDISFFQLYFTHRNKQNTNRKDAAQLAVKPVTSHSGILGYKTISSRVSISYCAITMDNLHHLTGCLGQSSL